MRVRARCAWLAPRRLHESAQRGVDTRTARTLLALQTPTQARELGLGERSPTRHAPAKSPQNARIWRSASVTLSAMASGPEASHDADEPGEANAPLESSARSTSRLLAHDADESVEVTAPLEPATHSASRVLPRVPGAARLPAEASQLVATAPLPPPQATPREPKPATRSNFPSLPPTLARVGRYDVVGRIAIGGMAEIYLAHEHVETGAVRQVAIKVLKRSETEPNDDYFEELFMREGRIAAQLVHPNICHVYEFGRWAESFYIAMEWIEGFSLRSVLEKLKKRQRQMPPVLAVGIAAQIAGALQYAHNVKDARKRPLQVVHLDVNPQNIMLRHDGVVKLLDFGIAQVADPRGDSRSDLLKGKLGYIAPEQAKKLPLDRRVDVFALGACLFEMLTGRPAYKRESLRESLEALLAAPVPSLREHVPELPLELEELVKKALAHEPSERFQSAGELQAALEGYLARNREVVSSRHIAQLVESITPTAPGPALYTGPEVASRLAPANSARPAADSAFDATADRRRRNLRLLVGALGLLLGALTAYLVSAPSAPAKPLVTTAAPAAAAPAPLPEPVVPVPSTAAKVMPPAIVDAPASAPPGPAATKVKRANRRRRIQHGFVADPGF